VAGSGYSHLAEEGRLAAVDVVGAGPIGDMAVLPEEGQQVGHLIQGRHTHVADQQAPGRTKQDAGVNLGVKMHRDFPDESFCFLLCWLS
jgi:hypothetical protein